MDKIVLDADLAIPTGIPATAQQVHQWLADGVITQEIFDALDESQRIIPEEVVVEDEEVV